jgi:hypothetical protein
VAVRQAGLLDRPRTRLEFGDCIATGLAAWGRNAPLCVLFNALVHAPLFAYTVSVLSGVSLHRDIESAEYEAFQRWSLVTMVATFFLPMITTGLVTYGIVQQLRGQRVSLVRGLAVGLRRLLPVVGVGLVVIVLVALGMVLTAMFAVAVSRGVWLGPLGEAVLLLLLCAVPSFLLIAEYWVAVPVAVLERHGLFGSLGRGRRLVSGSRWTVVGLLLVFCVTWFLVYLVTSAVSLASMRSVLARSLVVLGVNVVVGSVYSVMNVVGYSRLRAGKEGATIEDLAKVFD